MARKKRRKRNWIGTLLFLVSIPLVLWFLAFLIWFYWNDLNGLFGRRDKIPRAGKEVERSTKPFDKSTQERISEEDRRKLEEILKDKR